MTEKQEIIINGVDVSGCDFLAKEDIYNSYSGVTTAYKGQCGCSDDEMCKDHRNCGYKKLARQLQRKTAECEERGKEAEQWAYKADLTTGEALGYKQTLNDIEKIIQIIMETNKIYPLQTNLGKILDIISKAKGVKS